MSLLPFLTRERSRDRTLFFVCGCGFVAYSIWQFWRGNWGVACFLGGFGLISVAAGAMLREQQLNTLATGLVAVNVLAAVVALAFEGGVK